jgi:hypothetical protein
MPAPLLCSLDRRCLAELEGSTPSKQKRGRKAVPSTYSRAEAAMLPSDMEDRVASDQLGSLLVVSR